MLGKLIKHELKATSRIIPVLYLACIFVFLMGLLAKGLDISFLQGTSSFLLLIGAFAVSIVTFVVIVVRFHKNLFGNEGYLTLTLPVSETKIIISKAFVAFGWTILSYIGTFFCLYGLLYLNNIDLSFIGLSNYNLLDAIKLLFENKMIRGFAIYFIIVMITQSIMFIAEIYFAITLSNTKPFIKNNVLFTIVWMFVLNSVIGIIDAVAMILIPISLNFSTGELSTGLMLSSITQPEPAVLGIGNIFLEIIIAAVLFVLARWLLAKKASVK